MYYAPFMRNLYVYSSFDYENKMALPAAEEKELMSLNRDIYKDTYVMMLENDYYVFDFANGEVTDGKSDQGEWGGFLSVRSSFVPMGQSATLKCVLSIENNGEAYVFKYHFHKATFPERVYFIVNTIDYIKKI